MRKLLTAAVCAAVIAPLAPLAASTSAATSPDPSRDGRDPARLAEVKTKALRDAVTVGGILAHERVFQRIANQNDGTRQSGTAGYDASAAYVMGRLEAAGYRVRQQDFTFPFYRELAPAELSQTAPSPQDYEVATLDYSGSGDVTGTLVPTNDVAVPPPDEAGTAPGGCEPSAFEPAPAGPAVALVQRGTCTFEQKAANAQAAGYDAVVIFNEGQPGRTDTLTGTLAREFTVPVVGISYEDGADLYEQTQAGEVTVRVATSTENDPEGQTSNIIANTWRGSAERVVVVGAHLDSVAPGPGINDNGSGAATVLEIAEELSDLPGRLKQRVRFAFWGAEESGLLGSEHYVDSVTDENLANIKANLNFDMVGSPNYVRFVYDGDGSDIEPAGPEGSGDIEDVFTSYFDSQELASAPTQFSGRSDYGPFIAVGIPAGGLFTGAEGVKTEEEAAIFGGEAGVAYDSCYHQACDTIANLNLSAISEMSDAAADAVLTLARSATGFYAAGRWRRPPGAASQQHAVGHGRHHGEPRR